MFLQPPNGFPDSSIKLHPHEMPYFVSVNSQPFGNDMTLRFREMEGPFADFLERNFGKPVLLAGPVIPEPPMSSFSLEEKWDKFLGQFKAGSVIYCAFGSENILKKGQFQELLLGFELSGLPFFAVLKPPFGTETVEEALPDGFAGRVVGRGVVHSGWIQQQLILEHPSVGCYVTRCGSGSLREKVCKAIKTVMEENYSESSYVDDLSQKLQVLVN
ncbi:anthocyanidin 3-O-glucoside 2''-O-glucosyltransferase-like [Morus notabilis]|uniref:anthocyanidin 3-O-glucoside 2''-O-glucosyltransferase-like n=1 Tax=Morus notabilis TaxID=981085 RepID=UPI000CECF0F1|nr:anthocyanidin 3-O-glucoside 2''-O-glucosyltransferase-like [Morus notabilis]